MAKFSFIILLNVLVGCERNPDLDPNNAHQSAVKYSKMLGLDDTNIICQRAHGINFPTCFISYNSVAGRHVLQVRCDSFKCWPLEQ